MKPEDANTLQTFRAGNVIRRIEFPTTDEDEFKARLALRRVNPLMGYFDR